MKRLLIAALVAVPMLGGALAAPAQADTVTRSIVETGRLCNDGFGHSTTDTSWVRTKSGSVKVSCHFPAGTWPSSAKSNTFTFGDCPVTDFNGNRIVLNSRFIITGSGAANMTCN